MNTKEFIVLPDLEKKIDESVHDAINYFNKKCPYCDTLLFQGHIRNKIHIDHYIPISKGGQHVPWNILPVCQKCNSKKLAKTPKLFLSNQRTEVCENYLKSIADKYVGEIQLELEKYQQIKSTLNKYSSESEIILNGIEILKSIYQLVRGKIFTSVELSSTQTIPSKETIFDADEIIKNKIREIFKVPQENDVIERLSATELHKIIQPLIKYTFTRTRLSKLFKEMGFYLRSERDIKSNKAKRAFYFTFVS